MIIERLFQLQLVGLAFELHDTSKGIESGKNDPEFEITKITEPSLSDIFHYSFCYIGILTGM